MKREIERPIVKKFAKMKSLRRSDRRRLFLGSLDLGFDDEGRTE